MSASLLFRMPITTRKFSGPGYIAGESPGLVTVNTAAASREIECRDRRTRIVVATTFSASDGTYRFDGLDPNEEFDLIGRDWSGTYNDVIVSRVKPKAY
jgi:hypothetical protein